MSFTKIQYDVDSKFVEYCPELSSLTDNPEDRLTDFDYGTYPAGECLEIEHYDKWHYFMNITKGTAHRSKKFYDGDDWYFDCEEEINVDFKKLKKYLKGVK